MDFKSIHSFETRFQEASRIRQKFPGRIPVIVERLEKSKTIPLIDKQKFLVPPDLTLGQFVFVIRTRIKLSPEQALFVFVNNSLPTTGTIMRELYKSHQSDDGFLYLKYCGENVFGK